MDRSKTRFHEVLQILNEQRKTGEFCDIILKLGNDFQLWGHFAILAAQSDFIGGKYFLQKDMQFSIHNPLQIEICDFECTECLCDVFDFLYTHETPTPSTADHYEHLKRLSKLLNIQTLNSELLRNDLTMDNQPASQSSIDAANRHKERVPAFQYKVQSKPAQSKMHQCYGCAFKCYRPSEMLIHSNQCASDNKKCSLCNAEFRNHFDYIDHLKKHDNIKPFFCTATDCNLRFITKTALNLHKPKHSTEAPYVCAVCSKGFKWKHGLDSHLIVHSTEKKLLCDECGFSTSHLKTLRTHQLSHTGKIFRCSSIGCLYTTKRKENLTIHTATHRNETPFVCEVCGHRFSQNKNLKRHALIHVAKDLHKCHLCSFSSYRTDKLKDHISRQHIEKPLQLELSEDFQSALLRDTDMEMSLMPPLRKPRKLKKNTANASKKKNDNKNHKVALTKLRPILPKT